MCGHELRGTLGVIDGDKAPYCPFVWAEACPGTAGCACISAVGVDTGHEPPKEVGWEVAEVWRAEVVELAREDGEAGGLERGRGATPFRR